MFVIETQCYEDYGYCVKAKGGRSIVLDAGTRADAEAVACLIADDMEHILDIREVEATWVSRFVKDQLEWDSGSTVYVDPIVRQGKSGDYYLKRGYIVGNHVRGTEHAELEGKFCGWVDNLNTGKCVLKIEGDKRERLTEEE